MVAPIRQPGHVKEGYQLDLHQEPGKPALQVFTQHAAAEMEKNQKEFG